MVVVAGGRTSGSREGGGSSDGKGGEDGEGGGCGDLHDWKELAWKWRGWVKVEERRAPGFCSRASWKRGREGVVVVERGERIVLQERN